MSEVEVCIALYRIDGKIMDGTWDHRVSTDGTIKQLNYKPNIIGKQNAESGERTKSQRLSMS